MVFWFEKLLFLKSWSFNFKFLYSGDQQKYEKNLELSTRWSVCLNGIFTFNTSDELKNSKKNQYEIIKDSKQYT